MTDNRLTRRSVVGAGLALGAGMIARPAIAQSYPSGPIKLIVPFAAGSGTDVVARLLGIELGPRLGQTIVVEAMPGSAGNLATARLARSAPDGLTLILTTSAHSIAPSLFKDLTFDIAKDFAPVSLVCSGPLILTAHRDFAANSIQELVALAKKTPGKLNYASPGTGTAPHLAAELLKIKAGIDMVHVPYRGGNPAMTDVLANVVPMYFASPATAMPLVEAGSIKALGQSSARRPSFVPNIPTIAEQGYPDYRVDFWYGLLAPAGTPAPIVERLHAEVGEVLKMPKITEHFNKLGFEAAGLKPADFDRFIREEADVWAGVAKAAKLGA